VTVHVLNRPLRSDPRRLVHSAVGETLAALEAFVAAERERAEHELVEDLAAVLPEVDVALRLSAAAEVIEAERATDLRRRERLDAELGRAFSHTDPQRRSEEVLGLLEEQRDRIVARVDRRFPRARALVETMAA
jgi:hypothetical protein